MLGDVLPERLPKRVNKPVSCALASWNLSDDHLQGWDGTAPESSYDLAMDHVGYALRGMSTSPRNPLLRIFDDSL